MATLKCEVVSVTIKQHDNADALEIAQVRGYQSIVRKGQFNTDELAVYIPEQSIVPEWLLRRLNLWDHEKGMGKLAGSNGGRVKAVKLRGVTSQGLLYPLEFIADEDGNCMYLLQTDSGSYEVFEDEDVTEKLGIVKWEPPVPIAMAGEVVALAGKTLKYDIENVKNYPEIVDAFINLSIPVHITEKLHGTWACFGIYPEDIHDEIPYNRVVVTSKGLSGKGLAFKDNEANANNLYLKAFKKLFPEEVFEEIKVLACNTDRPIFFIGEIFGKGVQDLGYGMDDVAFRLFDIYSGLPGQGKYLPRNVVDYLMDAYSLPFEQVPVLHTGEIAWHLIDSLTSGADTINGVHIREGIVIRPLDNELKNGKIGRVILKSVSDDYINRKNGTEYN